MNNDVNLFGGDNGRSPFLDSRRIDKEFVRNRGILHILAEAQTIVELGAVDHRGLAQELTAAFGFHPRSARSICGRLIGSDPQEHLFWLDPVDGLLCNHPGRVGKVLYP